MDSSNHRIITENGLMGAGLRIDAINLIVAANQESDSIFHSGCFSLARQHFQGPTAGQDLANAKSFYYGALNGAAHNIAKAAEEIDDKKADPSITRAFYFFGRALHCIQDFYAHTNWVALGNTSCWDEITNPRLILSKSTPKKRLIHNLKGHKPYFFDTKKKREKWFLNMNLKKLEHPDIHLDFSGSFASKICNEFIGRFSGFSLAKHLATKHTAKAWNVLLRKAMERTDLARPLDTGRLRLALAKQFRAFNPGKYDFNEPRKTFLKNINNGFAAYRTA